MLVKYHLKLIYVTKCVVTSLQNHVQRVCLIWTLSIRTVHIKNHQGCLYGPQLKDIPLAFTHIIHNMFEFIHNMFELTGGVFSIVIGFVVETSGYTLSGA